MKPPRHVAPLDAPGRQVGYSSVCQLPGSMGRWRGRCSGPAAPPDRVRRHRDRRSRRPASSAPGQRRRPDQREGDALRLVTHLADLRWPAAPDALACLLTDVAGSTAPGHTPRPQARACHGIHCTPRGTRFACACVGTSCCSQRAWEAKGSGLLRSNRVPTCTSHRSPRPTGSQVGTKP
jgi:hypothetical protein